jgi:glycosyltransferase involved in cell wall biosynthesis
VFGAADLPARIGQESYSYHFVARALGPLLQRWGHVQEVRRPEGELDYAVWQMRRRGWQPLHLSFLPLHAMYLSGRVPNVAFPFWEFPDIPNRDIDEDLRANWRRVADRLSLILTASTHTRDAFVRAGVQTPVHVVPVPIQPEYFEVPEWSPEELSVLDCSYYSFPPPAGAPYSAPSAGLGERLRRSYRDSIRPRLPRVVDYCLKSATRLVLGRHDEGDVKVPYPYQHGLELSGIVYTSIFNPFDPRKNWQDLLSAFLLALRDEADAALVIKLVVGPKLARLAARRILDHYHALGLPHRCKLIVITGYLSDEQMVELTRASTYYLQATRAEGACLPLQDFLAAGRPGISPVHSALTDYFDSAVGLTVASHPEPTSWPTEPSGSCSTSWHRIVWQDLHDQIRAGYRLAKGHRSAYDDLARSARQRMAGHASAKQVWPRLAGALHSIDQGPIDDSQHGLVASLNDFARRN